MRHQAIRFFLQRNMFMKTMSSGVTLLLLWLFVYPTAAGAQMQAKRAPLASTRQPGDEAELAKTLERIERQLAKLDAKMVKAEDAAAEASELRALRQRLDKLHPQALKNFDRVAQHLKDKGLPQEIMKRHNEAVATYKREMHTLMVNLDAMEAAPTKAERRERSQRALAHLRAKNKRQQHRSFDPNNLPFGTPDSKVRKPKLTKEEFHAWLHPKEPVKVAATALSSGMLGSQQVSLKPTPEDLAETVDVQITNEIRTLATQLNHNPVEIYNWVYNHIEFMPTYGSIQGSQMTLENQKGNAFDTSSLLIALLRASDIPARYVIGTVQMPIEQVMNWVGGVTVPEATLEVLGQGGIPSTGLVEGGAIKAVQLEHVWVEAWIDFEPSRGAIHIAGDTWVPIDAAFKEYKHIQQVDIEHNVPFDMKSFVDEIISSAQSDIQSGWISGIDHHLIEEKLTAYQNQVLSYIASVSPDQVLTDKAISKTRNLMVSTQLPYEVAVRGDTIYQLPDNLRHKYRFILYSSVLNRENETPDMSFAEALPSLAGKKISISFIPATELDAKIITSYTPDLPIDGNKINFDQLRISLPGYLIHMVGKLMINNEVVAQSSIFTMGDELVSRSSLYAPIRGWRDAEDNYPIVGEYRTIAINPAGISRSQILSLANQIESTRLMFQSAIFDDMTLSKLIGDKLYSVILSYLAADDLMQQSSADAFQMISYRQPSFGSFTLIVQPYTIFSIPQIATFIGLELDIDQLTSVIVSKNNNITKQRIFTQNNGIRQSAYEHMIPDIILNTPEHPGLTISAVKAIRIASVQGQKIYKINQENINKVIPSLNIDNSIIDEIKQAVTAGKHAFVSQNNITFGDWVGVGYIIIDPETGAGAYKISGGANGAFYIGILAGAAMILFVATAAGAFLIPGISLLFSALLTIESILAFLLSVALANLAEEDGDEATDCFYSGLFLVGLLAAGLEYFLAGIARIFVGIDAVIATVIGDGTIEGCFE